MILLKGKLEPRDPIVKIGDRKKAYKKQVNHLGKAICAKLQKVTCFFTKDARANWCLKFNILRIIYSGVVLAIMTYAASA